MATFREFMDAAKRADAAGDEAGARRLVELAREAQRFEQAPQAQPKPSMASRIGGALVSGVTGGRVSTSAQQAQQPQEPQETQETPLFGGSMGGLTMGSFQRAPTRQEVGMGVRYAPPALAQMAASPSLAAPGLGPAALSFIGAAVGYPSSLLGQFIAGDEVSNREAMADAALAAMPFSTQGRFTLRAAFNVPAAIATVEGSDYIRNGEYQRPKTVGEAFSRWGAVAGMVGTASYLGARGGRVSDVEASRAALSAERMGGAVMLSESLPQLSPLEQRVVAAGNKRALKLMEEMDAPFNQAIAEAFPEGQSTQEFRQFIRGRQANVQRLQNEADQAERAARKARDQVERLSGGDNLRAYETSRRIAAETAFTARATRMAQEWTEQTALGQNVLNASDVNLGNRVRAVNETMQAGREALREGTREAYREAGITKNMPVVDLKGTLNAISASARSPESRISGRIASSSYRSWVKSYFEKYGTQSTPRGPKDTLSLEAYQMMQTELANDMASGGRLASLSEAQSSEVYEAVRSAHNRYISRNMPEARPAWDRVRNIVAEDFAIRETDAMKMLQSGNVEGFYSAIISEGQGQTMETIRRYASLLAESGQQEAAQAFVGSVNQIIGRGVLSRAIPQQNVGSGRDAITQIVDPKALIREIDILRSYHFPVDELGLGTREQIQAAARLNSVQASGGITKEMMEEFYQLSDTLGVKKATAKMNYYQAVRDEQLANGTRQQRLKAYQARQAAQKAGATADDRVEALLRAQDDPVTRLVMDKSFPVPEGATNSAMFNASLMAMEPSTASAFVQAMEQAGRGADLDNLRRGLVYGVMNRRTTNQYGQQVLDTRKIIDFFDSPDPLSRNRHAVFQRIMGDEAYKNLQENFVDPLRRIGGVRASMDAQPGMNLPTLVTRLRPSNDSPIRATAVGTSNMLIDLINMGRYNTLYALYVSPTTAPMWSKAMKSGALLTQQPVLVTAIRLAEEQDRKDAEAQQRR